MAGPDGVGRGPDQVEQSRAVVGGLSVGVIRDRELDTEITKDVILRAWRDDSYRETPPDDARSAIARPTHAEGDRLSEQEVESAADGTIGALAVIGGAGIAGTVGGFEAGKLLD